MNDIHSIPLFRGADPEVLDSVCSDYHWKHIDYGKGEIIALQGDPCRYLFLLDEGCVYARMVSDEGREFTLDMLYAPEVLASSFVFSTERIYPVTIIAGSACGLWAVGRDSIGRLVREDSAVLDNYLRVISDHSMFLNRKINEFALQTLSDRILGYIKKNGALQNLQDTAFILGVARPSLSRAVSQLVAQGVLRKNDDGYVMVR